MINHFSQVQYRIREISLHDVVTSYYVVVGYTIATATVKNRFIIVSLNREEVKWEIQLLNDLF